jgi:hypothetical protein
MDPENRLDEADSDQLEPEDTLDDSGIEDVLDEGYSPPERPWAVDDWGTTAREEAEREDLGDRLARELPDVTASDDDGIGDTTDTDGEPWDDEVGEVRSGRLMAEDEGEGLDDDDELYAVDVGVDGAAASAEEAAVHVVPEEPGPDE